MRKLILPIFLVGSFLFLLGWALVDVVGQEAQSPPAELDGKAIFVAEKCNMCHSIESAKVEMLAGGYQKAHEKNVPPDLSGIGKTRTADFMIKYLKKREAVEGVQHARLFRGTEKDLEVLCKWLETLK